MFAAGPVANAALAPAANNPGLYVSTTLDPTRGFPTWYKDASGTKLTTCTDAVKCPSTGLPVEGFYAYARGRTTLNGGGKIKWIAVLESTYTSGIASPTATDRTTFTRVQFTGTVNTSVYPPGSTLIAKTPLGDVTLTVSSKGTLSRDRKESTLGTPADWTSPVTETGTTYGGSSRTFIKWDSGAPAGYIGDVSIPHTITAPAGGRNWLRVFKSDGVTPVSPLVTQFDVAGQLAN